MISRRVFGQICAAAVVFGRRLLGAAGRAPLSWASQPECGTGWTRQYRAHAQIILLGIPVFHPSDVGDGSASWREWAGNDGEMVRLLEFTGRSAPERAGGLNRFGFIQELSRSGEAIYFGLMTSSPEESAAEARQALHANAKDAWYSAIDGRMSADGIETGRAHFLASAKTTPANRQILIERARQELAAAPRTKSEAGILPQPFLHALASLLGDSQKKQTQYAYNGRMYWLTAERAREAKSPGVVRVNGSLRRVEGGKPIEFRLWVEGASPHPLPLRIEYQAKSYLRLTFEAKA